MKYAKVEDMLKRERRLAYITGERNGRIKSARELCVRETRTVRTTRDGREMGEGDPRVEEAEA